MTTDFTTVASENVCLSVKVTVNMEKKIFEKILTLKVCAHVYVLYCIFVIYMREY